MKLIMPVISPLTLRVNGHIKISPGPGPARVTTAFDDEWDEDVVIGGKKLPGWFEMDEGRREVEKLGEILDRMDSLVRRLACCRI